MGCRSSKPSRKLNTDTKVNAVRCEGCVKAGTEICDHKAVQETKLKVLTFNIWAQCWIGYQEIKDTSITDWEVRIKKIVDYITKFDADVVCLQEVDVKTYDYLCTKAFPKMFHGPHSPNHVKTPEHPVVGTCIFTRPELKAVHFTWQAFRRGCSSVTLMPSLIEVINTHL